MVGTGGADYLNLGSNPNGGGPMIDASPGLQISINDSTTRSITMAQDGTDDAGDIGINIPSGNPLAHLEIQSSVDVVNSFNITSVNEGDQLAMTGFGNMGIGTFVPLSRLNVNGGVGIGTTLISGAYLNGNSAPAGGLIVQNNVGIGTFNPFGGKLIVSGGNVGVGSLTPGQLVDVQGTVRALYFIGNGSQLTNISAGGWTQVGNNVYNTNTGNVGINTTNGSNVGIGSASPGVSLDVQGTVRALYFSGNGAISGLTAGTIPQAASSTTLSNSVITQSSGNIGVGVAVPSAPLEVNGPIIADGSGSSYFSAGNVGVGTTNPQAAFVVVDGNVGIGTWTAAGGNLIVNGGGNVGINTLFPGKALDIQGTVRTVGFTMSGQTPISGYVLTASDGAGDTTWSSGGAVSGWTQSGSNVYETLGGNVGIGTTKITAAALTVMNGNVGIGTWVPQGALDVEGTLSVATFGGNVGIGWWFPSGTLDVEGGALRPVRMGPALHLMRRMPAGRVTIQAVQLT